MVLKRDLGSPLEELWIRPSSLHSIANTLTSPLSDVVEVGHLAIQTLLCLPRCLLLTLSLILSWAPRMMSLLMEMVARRVWILTAQKNSDPPLAPPPPARLGGVSWGLLGPSLRGGVLS